MTAENRYVIRRFFLKAGILTFFALAQWRIGFASTLGILFAIASMIDIGIAAFRRIPFRRSQLSYWDEAAALTLMSLAATVIATR